MDKFKCKENIINYIDDLDETTIIRKVHNFYFNNVYWLKNCFITVIWTSVWWELGFPFVDSVYWEWSVLQIS
jgi:hypothetical protein